MPLVASFEFAGEEITVVNTHFFSKEGSTPLFGQVQPPINGSELQRAEQAEIVNQFVDDALAEDAGANLVVLGDINEFEFEEPVTILESGNLEGSGDRELSNLSNGLAEEERYTFVFEGNSQSLDHVLASEGLAADAQFDIVHGNIEFAETPERASDHDPVVALFDFDDAPAIASTEAPEGALALADVLSSEPAGPSVQQSFAVTADAAPSASIDTLIAAPQDPAVA
jgi:uncharacterized protein